MPCSLLALHIFFQSMYLTVKDSIIPVLLKRKFKIKESNPYCKGSKFQSQDSNSGLHNFPPNVATRINPPQKNVNRKKSCQENLIL